MPRPSTPLMRIDEYVAILEGIPLPDRSPATADEVRDAMRLVRDGVVVSMGEGPAQPGTTASPDGDRVLPDDEPRPYALSRWEERGQGWAAVNHRFEVDVHGAASMTHIDALDHFSRRGAVLPGGRVDDLARGTVSRGVLVDVPGVLGVDVRPGEVITQEELDETLRRAGVEPRPGDALYLRLGRTGARCSHSDLATEPMPGLSFECRDWLAAVAPGVVVTDAGLDPSPSEVEGMPVPWHVLLLTALGIPLVDVAVLDGLSETCARLGRYEFASVLAPIPIPGASGSPVNPLALF